LRYYKSRKVALSEDAKNARKLAKAFGGLALRGTGKQKNWGEVLRAGKLERMALDDAIMLCAYEPAQEASWWIEHRQTLAHRIALQVRHLEEAKQCNTAS